MHRAGGIIGRCIGEAAPPIVWMTSGKLSLSEWSNSRLEVSLEHLVDTRKLGRNPGLRWLTAAGRPARLVELVLLADKTKKGGIRSHIILPPGLVLRSVLVAESADLPSAWPVEGFIDARCTGLSACPQMSKHVVSTFNRFFVPMAACGDPGNIENVSRKGSATRQADVALDFGK